MGHIVTRIVDVLFLGGLVVLEIGMVALVVIFIVHGLHTAGRQH